MTVAGGSVVYPEGWVRRPYQRRLWEYLLDGGRFAIAIWPRRHGKDEVALRATACSMLTRPGTYWHMLPQAAQARKAIWEGVNPRTGRKRVDEAFPGWMRTQTRGTDMWIQARSAGGIATWQLVGSDNVGNLVGSPPLGIVFSEWALADPQAWALLRPVIDENGGWALFITTPRGANHAKRMFDAASNDTSWFAEHLSSETTGVFTDATLERARRELMEAMGDAEGDAFFRQEYLCDWMAAIPGAYYAQMIARARAEGRVSSVPYDPAALVETWWDLGVSDATAIWFVQRIGAWLHVVDYYECSGEGLPHYARILEDKRQERGYVYGDIVFPHDIMSTEWGTGEVRFETACRLFGADRCMVVGTVPLSERGFVRDGIEQSRLAINRARFDAARCKRGLECLEQYARKWSETGKCFLDYPAHNWTSHAADAFRMGAMHRPIDPPPSTVRSTLRQIRRPSAWAA